MGKLEYLSKYTESSTDHKKKKKKKDKKSSSRKDREVGEVLVQDDDHDCFPIKQEDDEHDDDDDEDRPVVVPIVEDPKSGVSVNDPLKRHQLQQWSEIASGVNDTPMDDDNHDPPRRKRYDSDDDDELPMRQRYDSEDESNHVIKRGSEKSVHDAPKRSSPPSNDEKPSRDKRKRYDSSDDELPKRSELANHESSSKKKRYDSDHDDGPARESSHKPSSRSNGKRRRRRNRYDSDDEVAQIKREETSEELEPRRRTRYDSDDSIENRNDRARNSKKRLKSEEEGDNHDNNKGVRMSSGHVAGLQQAEKFREAEHVIQRNKRNDAQAMVDKYGMGDTVYRDEYGRQVADVVPKSRKYPQMSLKEQVEINKGRVQKEKEEQIQKDFQRLRESTFARHADDSGLEDLRKDIIRKGDPMAVYALKKKAKVHAASGKPQRPMYKGPAPKPNRFGIHPGYRWDGVDRGNGFEDKVLASRYSVDHKKEQAYRWSTSDM